MDATSYEINTYGGSFRSLRKIRTEEKNHCDELLVQTCYLSLSSNILLYHQVEKFT